MYKRIFPNRKNTRGKLFMKKIFSNAKKSVCLPFIAMLPWLLSSCSEIASGEAVPAAELNIVTTAATTADSFWETAPTSPPPVITEESTTVTEPPPADRTVTFTALGDNLIHSSIYKQAAARAAEEGAEGYDFTYAYAGVADLLDRTDITVLNQETLICGEGYEPSTYPLFNSPPELGEHMSELGVDVFTIANNHTLDMGEEGLADCLAYYDENGFVRVGAYFDDEDRKNIRIIEKNGLKISFLAYTENLNGLSLSGNTSLTIGRTDMEVMEEEIAAAKEISDICVVSLHWGLEDSGEQQEYQENDARRLAEAGADVIIGNHPHVLREIETIERSDGGQTIVAYSLGNFISAQSQGANLIGGILDFAVTVPDGTDITKISDVVFTPIITHYDSGYKNIRLYKLSDYTEELADSHGVRQYSRFSMEFITDYLSARRLLQEDPTVKEE